MALLYCEVQNALDVAYDDPADEGTVAIVYVRRTECCPFFFLLLLTGFGGFRPMQGGVNAVQFSLFAIPGSGIFGARGPGNP